MEVLGFSGICGIPRAGTFSSGVAQIHRLAYQLQLLITFEKINFVCLLYFLCIYFRAFDVNSIFGIKNTEFIIGLKKMTKVVRLATWEARLALAVVHNDGLWQSSMAQRRPLAKFNGTTTGKVQWPTL